MRIRVLFVGETLTTHVIFDKGVIDFMIASRIVDDGMFLRRCLEKSGFEVYHIPTLSAAAEFPENLEELRRYKVIILSDVGSDTILLHPEVFYESKPRPNRLKLVRDYVREYGGGFLMIGGYLSFQGLNAMARYQGTPIEEILPVELMPHDDRVEVPEGFNPRVTIKDHPITNGLPDKWPTLLGYNKTNLRPGVTLLAEYNGDPILAVWEVGKGRAAVFTSDCAPHWCTREFMSWEYYATLWERIVKWLAKEL